MIKEFLEYVIGLANTRVIDDGDRKFSTQKLYPIDQPTADPIGVRSLTGLVDYLKGIFDGDVSLLVHIVNPRKVVAFGRFNRDTKRDFYIQASAQLPSFPFERFLSTEEAIIKLQSGFVKNEDRDILLQVIGNVKEEAVQTYGDDGVSQTVTAKAGVATVAQVLVPNPVKLAPYRTFIEIEQPESNFIFRMQNGPKCALFEADGGAWENEAMRRVKEYLAATLQSEIESGRLQVIA